MTLPLIDHPDIQPIEGMTPNEKKKCYRVHNRMCFLTIEAWNNYATTQLTKWNLITGICWAIIFGIVIASIILYLNHLPSIVVILIVIIAFIGWFFGKKKYREAWGLHVDEGGNTTKEER